MSQIDECGELERKLTKFQFRISRKHRFRIYRKLEGMLRIERSAVARARPALSERVGNGQISAPPGGRRLARMVLERSRRHHALSEAMDGWVPTGELYMIRAGEESGTLAKALASIQAIGEKARQMQRSRDLCGRLSGLHGHPGVFVLYMFGVQLIDNMRKTAPKNVDGGDGRRGGSLRFHQAIGALSYCSSSLLLMRAHYRYACPLARACAPNSTCIPPWSWYRILQGSGFLLGLSALLGAQVPLKRSLEILEEQGNPWIRERINSRPSGGLARPQSWRGSAHRQI